jgi:hypothetical protein
MVIAGTAVSDLQGLENVESFGNELSIERNFNLLTLRHLGANLSDSYRTTIRNIKLRDNPSLVDLEGLRYIQRVDGGSPTLFC